MVLRRLQPIGTYFSGPGRRLTHICTPFRVSEGTPYEALHVDGLTRESKSLACRKANVDHGLATVDREASLFVFADRILIVINHFLILATELTEAEKYIAIVTLDLTMLRVFLKSCSEVAARSPTTEGCLPQLATSFQTLRGYAKEEKGEYGDGK